MRGIGFPRPTPRVGALRPTPQAGALRPTPQAGALRPTPQQNSCDKLPGSFSHPHAFMRIMSFAITKGRDDGRD